MPRFLTLALCCLLLSACLGLRSGGSSLPPPSHPQVAEARQAWNSNDMRKAESLYEKTTKLAALPQHEQYEAWERMSVAAQRNGRPRRALDALSKWAKADPAADTLPAWQDAWYTSALSLPPSDVIKQAQQLWKDKTRSNDARAQAALILMSRSWRPDAVLAAQPLLRDHYAQQVSLRRILLEQRAANEFRFIAPATLTALAQKSTGPELSFPGTVLLLEQARRGAGAASPDVARLRTTGALADPTLISTVLGATGIASMPASTMTMGDGTGPQYGAVCLALALPASGPVAPIAQKIRDGALAAQAELQQQGVTVQIKEIDSAAPDWLAALDALPANCAVVGGPLRAPLFSAAKAAGATTRRHFFTFLPQLEGGDEGSTAWRFFPSPADQVNALLRFTRDEMGITSYGAFYPSDTYGGRMTAIFDQAVRRSGGNVKAVSYPPAEMMQWTNAAKELLQPQVINKVPLSTATFGAVLLPDSWKNMEMVVTNLIYNGDDKQVLLGTTLWEQSLSAQSTVNTTNMALALFPGAWNPAQVPQGLAVSGGADFWKGLGYDFVRFGSALNIQAFGPAAGVNSRLLSAQRIPWGMAPMMWNGQGQASQQLFLFTPAPTGFVLLNAQEFKDKRAELLHRFEQRKSAAAAGAMPAPAAAPVITTPATPSAASATTTPAVRVPTMRTPSAIQGR